APCGVTQAISPYLKVDVTPLNIRNADEFAAAIASFARGPDDGLIVASSVLAMTHRHHLIELVARHKLPAIYGEGVYVADGGLMSYAPSIVDQFRRAAGYVDRILKGEKPADLPVQSPVAAPRHADGRRSRCIDCLGRADDIRRGRGDGGRSLLHRTGVQGGYIKQKVNIGSVCVCRKRYK